MREIKERRLRIAAICAVGPAIILACVSQVRDGSFLGAAFEALFLFAVSWIAWVVRAPKWLRGSGVLCLMIAAAPVSVYLGSLTFAKITVDFGSLVQDFLFRIVEVTLFLGITWLFERMVTRFRLKHSRPSENENVGA